MLSCKSGCLRSLCPKSLCLYPEASPDSVSLQSTSGSPPPRLPPHPESRRHEGPTRQQANLEVPVSPEYPCGAVTRGRSLAQSCGALSLSVMSRHSPRRQCRRRWAQMSSDVASPIRMSCWDMHRHPPGLRHPHLTIPGPSAARGSRTPHFHLSKHGVCIWLGLNKCGYHGLTFKYIVFENITIWAGRSGVRCWVHCTKFLWK